MTFQKCTRGGKKLMDVNDQIVLKRKLRLDEILKERGIQQQDLAALIPMTAANLSRIKNGMRAYTRDTAERIGHLLCVRPEWLLGEDDIKEPLDKPQEARRVDHLLDVFGSAGYRIEQITGERKRSPYDAYIIPISGTFWISDKKGTSHKCTYSDLIRLMAQLEAIEKALISSFVDTSERLTSEEVESDPDIQRIIAAHRKKVEAARKDFED
jgi:plasmid maintenance system antidote protein VapI